MAASVFPALLLAVAAVVLLLPAAEAVWLELPPSGTKCVSEEIQPNVVVLADYSIMYESHPSSHPTVAVKVRAPRVDDSLSDALGVRFRPVHSRA
jgi:hypothetical protein